MIKDRLREIVFKLRGEVSTRELIRRGLTVDSGFERNENCIIDQSHCWLITIGNSVTLAPNVHILAHDAAMWRALGYTKIAPVVIGNNVFIGAGSVILPGVTIGDDVVIGAGSVVVKDIAGNTVAAGNPAAKICSYEAFISRNRKWMEAAPCYDGSYTLRNRRITKRQKEQMRQELEQFGFGFVE